MSPTWILLLALAGVEPTKGEVAFEPTAAEADVPELFRLPPARFTYEMEPRLETPRYRVFAVRFPSPVVTPVAENNIVHADYFEPKGGGKRPAVVVLHILGADFALARYLAARLADRGVASLFVKLPYYGERRPKGGDQRFLSADIERSVGSMRQGVLDVRRGLAWLAARPEVDANALGVTGISLGGIISSLAAAAEPRVARAAFLLAGGGLDDILWNMPEPQARRYRDAWIQAGKTREDFAKLTRPLDPLTHAHRLAGKRLMMIAGTIDDVIPPTAASALWKAAGEPPITWYECGHYSAAGFLLPAIRRTVDFFASDLPPPTDVPPPR
ncbi:MAG: alpha/beta hydrolase family protein [Isosphaeraceae bacterium]|nr:alpha/beta hydrolase family protein [Isosphaeraceae bacterium]